MGAGGLAEGLVEAAEVEVSAGSAEGHREAVALEAAGRARHDGSR